MLRFRKKSDAKQQQQASPRGTSFAGSVYSNSSVLDITAPAPAPTQSPAPGQQQAGAQIGLPLLPEGNDFRSSLIIPTLSRRFTVLRESQGESTFDSLRNKFAEQRAAGAENQITEEEEDLMLDALDRISRDTANDDSTGDRTLASYYGRAVGPPSPPITPNGQRAGPSFAFPSSPSTMSIHSVSEGSADASGSRVNKRRSNNLFGSGRFRDQSYIRTARANSGTSQASMSTASRPRYQSVETSSTSSSTATSSSTVVREPSSSTLSSIRIQEASKEEEDGSETTVDSAITATLATTATSMPADDSLALSLAVPELSLKQQRRVSLALQAALLSLAPEDDDDIVVAPRAVRSPTPSKTNGTHNAKSTSLNAALFPADGTEPHSTSPPSVISDEFDRASALWSGDDIQLSAQKREWHDDSHNDMSVSPPPQPTAFAAAGMRPSNFNALRQRSPSPARADSTTPRAISPPGFPPTNARGPQQNRAPQLSTSILPRSALPRNDSPAPGLHGQAKSNSSFGSFAEIVRGFSRLETAVSEQDDHPYPLGKSSGRPMSPPQQARSPTPNSSSHGAAWMAGAAYYQNQHRGMDSQRTGMVTPDYSRERERWGSMSMSDESVVIDPYRNQSNAQAHGRTKSMLSSRSLSSPPLPESPTLDSFPGGIDYGSLTGAWDLDNGYTPQQPLHGRSGSVDMGGGANGGSRPGTPRSPPFLARSPSRGGYGHRTMTPEPEYAAQAAAAAASVRHFSATPPPAPSPGVGRPRTPSRSRYHSPPSSASGSYSNINSATSNPLVLAPFNASAASVASAGSSYHSDAGNSADDAALQALLSPDPAGRKRKWDDFTGDPVTYPRKIGIEREDGQGFDEHEPVDVLRGVLGVNKDDILAIQTTLLQVTLQVKDTVDPPPRRAPSLRRRRGSVGESISSRTTSPAPGGQHVSPKNSMSPFITSAIQQPSSILLSALGTSPSRSFSPPPPPSAPTSPGPEPPSSPGPLTGSDTERERTPAPRNHFGMARSNDRGRALLTSMMESIESHKPKQQDPNPAAAVRQQAMQLPSNLQPATPMADSSSSNGTLLSDLRPHSPPVQTTPPLQQPSQHEQRRAPQPVASPSSQIPINFARPLSPQLQSPSRAMSPIQPASGVVTPARALSPPLSGPWSPLPDDSPPRVLSPVGTKAQHSLTASQSSDLSSIIRNQALADAIFGPTEDDSRFSAAQAQSLRSTPSTPDEELDLQLTAPAQFDHTPSPYDQTPSDHVSPQMHPHHVEPSPPHPQRYNSPSPEPYEQYDYGHSPNKHSYNSSSSPLPPDDAQLEQDVRRRVEQATAALKSASQVSLRERSNSVKRKKINPSKISGPQLMSASTSVDVMPSLSSPSPALSSPGGDGPKSTGSKFSQRFKKFGTWRNKPATPAPEEPQQQYGHNLSPYSPGSSTPTGTFSQSVRVNSHVSELSGPASASLADVNHHRFPANSPGHSPPASAGPAFRSFVSRLGKPFGASSTDLSLPRSERERVTPHHYAPPTSPRSPNSPAAPIHGTPTRSPSELKRADSALSGRYLGARVASPLGNEPQSRGRLSIDEVAPRSPEQALRTIYDAASQVGLNPDAMEELSALLNRSMSTTSRAPTTDPRQTPVFTRESLDSSSVPPQAVVERQRTIRATGLRDKKAAISRSNTIRDEDTRSIVLRRTIYLASDGTPAIPTDSRGQNLNRRPSHMSHKRQSSDAGVSVRSSKLAAYDGAGSPPPRAISRAMSTDTPPPMPDFNPAFLDASSAGLAGGSDSSMIEYYGDSRAGTPARDRHLSVSPYPASRRSADRGPGADASAQALEVLELADGRVVWQVVDGLRDDWDNDSEVDFRSRTSFDSGYSQEHEPDLTLHLREHRRGNSKGSMSSAMLQRKSTYNRPQTKVFYSDAEHIGRLIESMTRGIDSGSFTVQHNGVPALPPPLPGRGSFDQDGNWTMEEHLEHVLQHVSPKSGPRAI